MSNTSFNTSITIGSYVVYKDTTYLVVALRGNLAVILNPLKGNSKLQVGISKLTVTRSGNTVVVEYNGNDYIVTHGMTIVSVRTGRVMNWAKCDANRKNILKLRDAVIGAELMESEAECDMETFAG